MKRNRWSVLGILAALTLVALVAPVGVSARKVANSGPFRMDITSSYVHINDGFELSRDPRRSPECSDGADNDQNGVADSMDPKCVSGPAGQPASDDDDEFAPGFQPADATFLEGQIDDNGQVTIPSTGVHFKPMRRMFVNPLGGPSAVIRADIVGAGVSTGSLDPISGDAELEMKLRVRLSGDIWGNPLPESCSIGSERDPITVRLTSGLTPPTQRFAVSGGNPLTGPYVSLISTQFSVPAASGCLLGGWLDISSTISDSQYLPAPGGTSMFRIDGRIAPAPVPGVVAKVEPVIQDNVSGVVPFDVAFAGSGSTVANGPATYEWDFGDGTTSTEANPMHTFKAPGTYSVILRVTDADGDSAAAWTRVTTTGGDAENPGPVALIRYRTPRPLPKIAPVRVPFDASYSEVTSGPATYRWDFGDGESSTEMMADHTYPEAGVYPVTLSVTDALGRTSVANTRITVLPPHDPAAEITASVNGQANPDAPIEGQVPLTVDFNGSNSRTGNGPLSYSWDFGDGTTSVGERVNHTFTELGTFKITMVATDSRGAIGVDHSYITVTEPGGTPPSSGTLWLSIPGLNHYRDYRLVGDVFGDVQVRKDDFGLVSVDGTITVPSDLGGRARVSIRVNRVWILPAWIGEVRVVDKAARVDLTTPVVGPMSFRESVIDGVPSTSVGSKSTWFKTGSVAEFLQPYTLDWYLIDKG